MAVRIEKNVFVQLVRGTLQKNTFSHEIHRRAYSLKSGGPSEGLSSQLFNTAKVQGILTRLTGMDVRKVFRNSKEKLEPPTYRLIGDAKLKELEEEARAEATKRLQMPPVLDVRNEITEVLSENPELDGLDKSKFVFTDITYDLGNRERFIVVREPNGILRKAKWEERDRVLQIYFPRSHRQLIPPPLFNDENIPLILSQDRHESLLDAACVQFEPDALEFMKIHERTYEDIDSKEKYDLLRSTRHFGGLVFYLTRKQRIDGMLVDMIQGNRIPDGVDLIRLYHLLLPECQSAVEVQANQLDGTDVIQAFVEHDAKNTGRLELVFQSYMNERATQDAETEEHASETQR